VIACRQIFQRERSTICGSWATARSVVVDSGLLVGLLRRDDQFHSWAVARSRQFPAPWLTCEAVLSEAFFLVGRIGRKSLLGFLRRGLVEIRFDLAAELEPVARLLDKYSNVPMSLADACVVRMSEILPDPIVLTTDDDFHIYRRHSRQVVPCKIP
jgi:predicted nucleic acid-binding protein